MFFLWKLLVFQYLHDIRILQIMSANTYVVRICTTDGANMPGTVPIALLSLQTSPGNLTFHWLPLDTSSGTVSTYIHPELDTSTADTVQQPNLDMGRRWIFEGVVTDSISKQRHCPSMGILCICIPFYRCFLVFIFCIFNPLKQGSYCIHHLL